MSRSHDARPIAGPARQRGIVLVLALIFLLLATLLATGAVGQALLLERMAGGQRNAQLASIAAESALRGAQWRLWKGAATGPLRCGTAPIADCHVYDPALPDALVRAFRREPGWGAETGTEYRGSTGRDDFTAPAGSGLERDAARTAVLAKPPRYLVEDLGPAWPASAGTTAGAGHRIYRITARATGGDAKVARVVENFFVAGGD
ncbi:pilus assembly PilX family protein [Dyella sp. 2RAB6]|uniref:pilus assembly PilX family protein n=1 Tax=Dyella sp. 2RAB6 TaxID=3232992 RepID=UPI003F900AC7